MKIKIYTITTRSGLHCGIGQDLSGIDLPIPTAKECVTGYPLIPGYSLRGVLREKFDDGSDIFYAAFVGRPAPEKTAYHPGALRFSDARLICLPVRSWFGTFAYMASPTSLQIFKTVLEQAGISQLPEIPFLVRDDASYQAILPAESRLTQPGQANVRILLEDLDLTVNTASQNLAQSWADLLAKHFYPDDQRSRTLFTERFTIVDDDIMTFLCETSLPVAAHHAIGENGIVKPDALWYKEFVPPETLFIGAIYVANPQGIFPDLSDNILLEHVCRQPIDIQVGGGATRGRGLITMGFISVEK